MTQEIVYWREESRWESKSIPLGGSLYSPRQILFLLIFGAFGLAAAILVPTRVSGIPLLLNVIVLLSFLVAGYFVGSIRIRMLPFEFQLFFRLFLFRSVLSREKEKEEKRKPGEALTEAVAVGKAEAATITKSDYELNVGTPLVFAQRLPKTPSTQLKIMLVLDSKVVDEDWISQSKKSYRLRYQPSPEDIGAHDLEIRVEGYKEPVQKVSVTVKSGSLDLLDSVK